MKRQRENRNENRQVRIYSGKLYKWQQAAVNYLLRFQKKAILTVLSPRQCGKTHLIQMVSLSQCINHKNFRVVIINPTFSNAKRTYKELKKWLRQMPSEIVETANSSDLLIEFTNGSSIQLKSIEQGDGLRGDHCNLLIIDEAAFISVTDAMTLVFPYTNQTQGTIVLISTPTFKDENNLFYKFYKKGQDEQRKPLKERSSLISYIDWTRYDLSAVLPPERKKFYKETMPWNIYANEIEGQFLSEKSDLWDIAPVLRNGILPTDGMFAGLDWASSGTDETVLTIFNKHKQMYQMVRLSPSEHTPTEQIDIILKVLRETGVKKVVYESNSIGTPMADFMKKKAMQLKMKCQFVAFDTNNTSKREIVEHLQLEIQNQTCTLLDDHQLKLEFAMFEMKKTKTGLITYGNRSDNVHDDVVVSVALALSGEGKGSYAVR